ncbi:PilZ domain-containing protein [Pokkaliibacter sp. MBI-7]|uniref:Cyclic diguanosine monophosphate-binding protein n=1 Tax=Proteobacteria bacterium 228 TaxID=2083153 RepID=A0A2S5KQI4_9PROT|nr:MULTISPECIES: PilZ domain-containing protein [Pokkaliibacter]MDH2433848.1 PilZ domain-containing protein [Pokkaliibacter sp. MBI-7]PPC76952.1 PilZ domain-containing protein [Pokkaliibacter plantistimulans]
MDNKINRRRFTRLPLEMQADLTTSKDRYTVTVLDVSLHGVLLMQPEQMEPLIGEAARVDLALSEEVTIQMPVTIVHAEEGLLGCEVRAIDVESLAHLRRMLELNLGDTTLVERELVQLLEKQQ